MKKNIVFGFGFGLLLWGSTAGAVVTPTIEQSGPLLSAAMATATTINAGIAASSTAITKAVDASATKIETAIAASATKIQASVNASATKIEAAIAVGATTIDASVDASATKVQAAVDASATKIETGVAASATKIEAAIIGNNKPGGTVYLFAFDGTNFFPLRGDVANGLDVDVTRVQGLVNVGQPGTSLDVFGITRTQTGRVIPDGSGVAAHVLPIGAVASASSYAVVLGAGAITNLIPVLLVGASHLMIYNDSMLSIFLGGADVAISGDHKGITLSSGGSLALDGINTSYVIYAVKNTAGTCQVMRW